MDDLTRRQLEAIANFSEAARHLDCSLWLRGGWAMDFVLARVSRPHRDIDWFALAEDAEALVDHLRQHGWIDTDHAPRQQQRDLVKGDLDFSIALIRLADGLPTVAGGPFTGAPWPSTMIANAQRRQLHDADANVIGIEAQIEIKQMMPTWTPHLRRRQQDVDDIRLLEIALTR